MSIKLRRGRAKQMLSFAHIRAHLLAVPVSADGARFLCQEDPLADEGAFISSNKDGGSSTFFFDTLYFLVYITVSSSISLLYFHFHRHQCFRQLQGLHHGLIRELLHLGQALQPCSSQTDRTQHTRAAAMIGRL